MSSIANAFTSMISGTATDSTEIDSTEIDNTEIDGAEVVTGQMIPIEGKEMKKGKAGGQLFQVTDEEYIMRCLILGTTKNTYYASSSELTDECVQFVNKMLDDGKGHIVLNAVKNVYMTGRTPKLDNVFLILGLCCSHKRVEVRQQSYEIVKLLRTFSHLYSWKTYQTKFTKSKGFGRLSKKAISEMIRNLDPSQLIYQVIKYPHRKVGTELWGILDFLRCIHIKGSELSPEMNYIFKYITKGFESANKNYPTLNNSMVYKIVNAVSEIKEMNESEINIHNCAGYIREYNLPREILQSWMLSKYHIWEALLTDKLKTKITMPMTALVRNLANMTSKGLFNDNVLVELVCSHVVNKEVIRKSRLHPIAILIALTRYQSGHGDKGKLAWTPNNKIVEALDKAFYLAFSNVKMTNKRILHGIDCSGSMQTGIGSLSNISSQQACTVLAMIFAKIEKKNQRFIGFTATNSYTKKQNELSDSGYREININGNMTISEAVVHTKFSDFGSTDCSLPIEIAIKEFKNSNGTSGLYDAFIIYTDNETYAGRRHPSVALNEYREITGIPAKMIVIGTLASATSIADPSDSGMLDAIGFDSNLPEIVLNFIRDDPSDFDDYEISELEI